MKIKLFLTAALISAASLSAHAGIHFGFSIGLPFPALVVAPPPAPVVVAAPPAPVVVAAPAPVYAAPAVVVATPACPGPGYVWSPGYWSVGTCGRVWVGGCWHYGPAHYGYYYGHPHGYWRR